MTNPNALILLILPALILVLMAWQGRQSIKQLNRLGDASLIQSLTDQVNYRNRRWKQGLWLGTLCFVILALARPAWGIADEVIEAEGVAVIVVLDVSASMDARDVSPSRIERAKLAARQLFEQSRNYEMGLILFAGDAFVQFPLTNDYLSAITFLDAASTDSVTRQGTAVADALQLAIDSFDERIAAESIIVLMTDGENHEGLPIQAAEAAAEQGITIHVLGFGTPDGATIPILNEAGEVVEVKTDFDGGVVVSRLDEMTLIQIAEAANGIYRRATTSGIEIIDLLNAMQEVEAQDRASRLQIRKIDRSGIFIFLALITLGSSILLQERRT